MRLAVFGNEGSYLGLRKYKRMAVSGNKSCILERSRTILAVTVCNLPICRTRAGHLTAERTGVVSTEPGV
eukprot:4711663-Pleurochrysis_carterae.AAC.1